jgi:hypothetical protein
MVRSSILSISCLSMLSACFVETKKEPVTVREPPPPAEEAPPPAEEPPPPVVRDHRTPREEPPPPPPVDVRDHRTHPPRRSVWDSSGWTLLGERTVSGGADKDFIRVSERRGPFTRLMMVVEEGDIRMDKIIITYENGRKHSPKVRHEFREGQRTRAIDLTGDVRGIQEIELRYGNLDRGATARVQIWGRQG